MYNTNNTSNNNLGSHYPRKSESFQQQQQQQQQQIMSHVSALVTPKSTSRPITARLLLARGHQPEVQTSVPNTVTQSPEAKAPSTQDNQNITIKLETNQSVVEESKEDKQEIKWPAKRKLNKKEQKKRLNARMRRLVCPKSPLMVFSELYKDVPIKLEEQTHNNCVIFTASIEVDGQLYTGDHVSKTQAKQKACENLLRVMLSKKINERPSSDEKETTFAIEVDMEMDDTENTTVKPKGPPQEDFPWPHFASLAMHNLISHWDLQPASKTMQDVTSGKIPTKIGGMKKFPSNPENFNPVQLLHQMSPGIKFKETTISSIIPSLFEASCDINNATFMGQGPTKKAAKKECAIATIKYFWNFDFHNINKK